MTSVTATQPITRSSVPAKVGVVLAVLQAIAGVVVVLSDFGTELPGLAVNVLTIVLGAAVLLFAVPAWRGARRAAVVLAVSVVLLSLGGVFAFFLPGIPAAAVIAASVGILVAVATAVLLLIPRRS